MTVNTPIIDTDTDSAQSFRLAVVGSLFVLASALNIRTGVISIPVLTSTGNFTATVSAFNCVVDGTSNALQGGYPVAVDALGSVTITAAHPSLARVDLVSLQIQDNAYDASGQKRGQLVVTAGTPSGSPVAPTGPASSLPLWTIPVPAAAGSINFASATPVYPCTAAAGGVVYVRNSADKPAALGGVQLRWRGDVTAAAGSTSPLEATVDGATYKPVYDASVVPATTTSAINTAAASLSASIAAVSAANTYGSWASPTAATNWSLSGSIPFALRTAPGGSVQTQGAFASTTSISAGVTTLVAAGGLGSATPSANRFCTAWANVSGGGTLAPCMVTFATNGAVLVSGLPSMASGASIAIDGITYAL